MVFVGRSHNPRPMFPFRTLLLLLLTLPGLLVPAGFGLGRCECTGRLRVVRDGATPTCMVAPQAQPAAGRACCHREAVPGPAGESLAAHRGKDCVCEASVVAPVPPKLAPGAKKIDPPLALLGAVPPHMDLPLQVTRRVWTVVSRGPPAPGAHRNLPLLL